MGKLQVNVSDSLEGRLKEWANDYGLSLSSMCCYIIGREVDRMDAEKLSVRYFKSTSDDFGMLKA